jgi:hypothetical protein
MRTYQIFARLSAARIIGEPLGILSAWSDIAISIPSNLADVSHVWISFWLKRNGWAGYQSTVQAMSYAMETVEEIEQRERQVSDDG